MLEAAPVCGTLCRWLCWCPLCVCVWDTCSVSLLVELANEKATAASIDLGWRSLGLRAGLQGPSGGVTGSQSCWRHFSNPLTKCNQNTYSQVPSFPCNFFFSHKKAITLMKKHINPPRWLIFTIFYYHIAINISKIPKELLKRKSLMKTQKSNYRTNQKKTSKLNIVVNKNQGQVYLAANRMNIN